jgi:hypothetical protein
MRIMELRNDAYKSIDKSRFGNLRAKKLTKKNFLAATTY